MQDNQAFSAAKGTLRGLHFQTAPHAQAKLIRALKGAIFDVVVDIRPGSATYGQWVAADADRRGRRAALGARAASPTATAPSPTTARSSTRSTATTRRQTEGGMLWNDPDLAIAWPVDGEPLLSDKDQVLPRLKDLGAGQLLVDRRAIGVRRLRVAPASAKPTIIKAHAPGSGTPGAGPPPPCRFHPMTSKASRSASVIASVWPLASVGSMIPVPLDAQRPGR